MRLARHLLTRTYRYLRGEVLVLPSRTAALVFCVGLLMVPLFMRHPYYLRMLILASIFALFAASWDLLSGYTGQMNFGHALFFGVAAYSAALLNIHTPLPPPLTIPLGAIAAVAAGLVVGVPCLRLRGPYLALATLAFPIILTAIVFAFPDTTGGELGVWGIDKLSGSRVTDYYICVSVMLALGFVMWKLGNSKTGMIFHAIREDEIAARMSGINTTRYRLVAFSLSALFAGVAGGLYAHFMRVAGPSSLDVMLSFQVIIWAVVGGMGTIYGPIAGAFGLYLLTEWLRIVPETRNLIFAVVVLVVLLIMPEGLTTWARDRIERDCPRCKMKNLVVRRSCRVCEAALGETGA